MYEIYVAKKTDYEQSIIVYGYRNNDPRKIDAIKNAKRCAFVLNQITLNKAYIAPKIGDLSIPQFKGYLSKCQMPFYRQTQAINEYVRANRTKDMSEIFKLNGAYLDKITLDCLSVRQQNEYTSRYINLVDCDTRDELYYHEWIAVD